MPDTKIQKFIHANIIRNRLVQYSVVHKISVAEARKRFAEFLEISKNQATYWERNTSQPNREQEVLIQQFFGLNHDDIFITKPY